VQLNNPSGICRQKFFPYCTEVMGEKKSPMNGES
jgi:hypothetical protein